MDYEREYKRKLQEEINAANRSDETKRLIKQLEKHEEEIIAEVERERAGLEQTIQRLKDAEYGAQREFISKAYDEYAEKNYQVQLERNEVLREILKELKYISSVLERRYD